MSDELGRVIDEVEFEQLEEHIAELEKQLADEKYANKVRLGKIKDNLETLLADAVGEALVTAFPEVEDLIRGGK